MRQFASSQSVPLNRVSYMRLLVAFVPGNREENMATGGVDIFFDQGSKASAAIIKPINMNKRVWDLFEVAGLDARLAIFPHGCAPPLCIEFLVSL